MKKIFNSALLIAATLFTFNACSDVPAPYEVDGGDDGTTYINESFASSLGSFQSESASGTLAWINDYSSAMITGYDRTTTPPSNQAGVTYLLSSAIDLSKSTAAYVTFNHAINYEQGSIEDNNQLVISKDYVDDVKTATWIALKINTTGTNTSFTFVSSGKVIIPSDFIGQSNVRVALRHTCSSSTSSTWEVKNFSVVEGTGEDITPEPSDNSKDNPYSVSTVLEKQDGTTAWVKGFIVGGVTSDNTVTTVEKEGDVIFGTEKVRASAIVIAETAGETDYKKCLVIGFGNDSPDTKPALNLVDNKGNLGKEVILHGNLTNAFKAAGMKTIIGAVLDGKEIGGTEPDIPVEGAYIDEKFSASLGTFTSKSAEGALTWIYSSNYKCAMVTGYDSSAKTNQAGVTYLVSKSVDLSNSANAYISFKHAINYETTSNINNNHQLVISKDYSGDVKTATWQTLTIKMASGNTFTFVESGKVAIPAEFIGQSNVTVALKHTCGAEKSSTWEVQDFVVAEGKGDVPGEGGETGGGETGGGETVTGENLLSNSGFENWTDNVPNSWNTNAVGNAVIAQNTDAYEGTYSVLVTNSDQNKRLASTEMTLDAGTYTLATYAKNATSGSTAKIRLGYVTVANGAATSNNDYQYLIDPTAVTDAWAQYSAGEFTLDSKKTVSLIIMSSKSSANVLIDNVILIKK